MLLNDGVECNFHPPGRHTRRLPNDDIKFCLGLRCAVAHPDDCEILAAGTLALLKKKGWEIHIVSMTPGDCGSADRGPEEIAAIQPGRGRGGGGGDPRDLPASRLATSTSPAVDEVTLRRSDRPDRGRSPPPSCSRTTCRIT